MKAKTIFIILGFLVAVFYTYGILTCNWFAWWMIPTGGISIGYMIGFIIYEIRKVRKGEWQ